MKKVGIVTLHFSINYGAILQCMALQNYLNKRGNETEVVDYVPDYLQEYWRPWISPIDACKKRLIYCGKNPVKTSGIMIKTFFRTIGLNKNYFSKKKKYDKFQSFLSRYVKLSSKHFSDIDELEAKCSRYDVIFSGSDQVWNPSFTKGKIDEVYLLNFGEGKYTKATYAASSGIMGNDEYLGMLAHNIKDIPYISVREKSLAKSLNSKDSNLNVTRVIDPTLLIGADEWKKYESTAGVPKEKYILVYCLKQHEEIAQVLSVLKQKLEIPVVDLSPSQVSNEKQDTLNESSCGPDEFLGFIDKAEFVITNSFHASVFSILFEKKFLTIPDDSTGSRMVDLLGDFMLMDRVYDSTRDVAEYLDDVDYSKAREQLRILRGEADSFLTKAGV